jgi:acetolactate synthase regulatory subunit
MMHNDENAHEAVLRVVNSTGVQTCILFQKQMRKTKYACVSLIVTR